MSDIGISFNKYEPTHVKAWGYWWVLNEAEYYHDPRAYYAEHGGLPELYQEFEAGIEDALGSPTLYTVSQVADKLGCTGRYIRYEVQHGRLPAFKAGRLHLIKGHDFARWQAARRSGRRRRKHSRG